MRLLTVLLVLFTSQLSAQFNTIDGKTFRRLSEFAMPTKNFGVDTVKSISITDTSRASGLLLLSKDTTAMYVYGDTMQMFTTAKKWNFTPSLPCCLPDTLDLNYINIVNCQPNRNEFLIARPNNTITTTECDTISYLYVDTIIASYIAGLSGEFIPLAGTDSASPVTGNIELDVVGVGQISIYANKEMPEDFIPKISFNPGNFAIYIESDDSSTAYGYTRNGMAISTDDITFKGIYSTQYFGANYDSLTYVQKKYVDDNFTPNSSILTNSATLDFGSIGAHDFEDLTLTVTGAADGDVVSLGLPNSAVVTNASYFAWVSATDIVTIRCFNINGGSIDPPSAVFKVKVFKD
jgi:hypothetical protein